MPTPPCLLPGGVEARLHLQSHKALNRLLLPAERPCELVGAFPVSLLRPRLLLLRQLRNCGAWIHLPSRRRGSGRHSAQARAFRTRGARRSVEAGVSSGRGDPAAGERAGDRAPPLQPWQPCATRAWTTRTARTSCPRAGSREPPRTAGFTMPSKGAAGGPPGLGRSWNPDRSPARDSALPSNATCAGRAAGSRSGLAREGEVAVMVEELQREGCRGSEDGPSPSLALGPAGVTWRRSGAPSAAQ